MSVLSIEGLNKSYSVGFIPKKTQVLKNVGFQVDSGKITGFLGGNGAGKTTTMKCMLGLAHPDAGKIHYFDDRILSLEVKKRIGFLPERPYFYEYLTGYEFLKFYGQLSTKMKRNELHDRILSLIKRVDLFHAKDRKLREYSKGMVQKIGIAQALIHDPEFLILDEPMSGLDPDGRYYLSELIREAAKEGRAIFLSSHLLPDAEKLCENLVILKKGEVIFQGSTEQFMSKMGDAATIYYVASGKNQTHHVNDANELQSFMHKIIGEGAHIVEVRRDRNLEEAFIKFGLRGEL